ncbi:hypothetical protein B0H19DRAFT_1258143 [Mycena capillaripes]|nr:hypothetical protein B0H19DRAFT_1258143 [Mycena capillaripes]
MLNLAKRCVFLPIPRLLFILSFPTLSLLYSSSFYIVSFPSSLQYPDDLFSHSLCAWTLPRACSSRKPLSRTLCDRSPRLRAGDPSCRSSHRPLCALSVTTSFELRIRHALRLPAPQAAPAHLQQHDTARGSPNGY